MHILALEAGWNQSDEYQNNEASPREKCPERAAPQSPGKRHENHYDWQRLGQTASSNQDHVQGSHVGDIPTNDDSQNRSTPAVEIKVFLNPALKKIMMEMLY